MQIKENPEANLRVLRTGDGNRTRVSCLGSTRPTIERRPRNGADITRGVVISQA